MIKHGIDARDMPLEEESVDTIITSPPYWGLRSYGPDGDEIGRGDLGQYLVEIKEFLDEAHRVLKPTGVLWLNMGDTASGSGGAGGDYNSGGSRQAKPKYRQGRSFVPPGQWCLIPQRVSLILQNDGWLIRSVITWDKGKLRPESLAHVRRPGVQTEQIILAAKTRDYRFYPERLEEKGDVWHIPPARGSSHLAPYPEELVKRCVLASTDPGDVVLDPFVGSGTTVRVAETLGRHGIGFDLYDFGGA